MTWTHEDLVTICWTIFGVALVLSCALALRGSP